MFHLVYFSSATRLFTEEELVELLEKSRANNTSLGVTGMLLYRDGNLMQVLEGEEETVTGLFDTIRRDARHFGVNAVLHEEIAERQFPDWSMAFRNFDRDDTELPAGYSNFLNTPWSADEFSDPSKSHRLLSVFKKHLR